MKRMKQKYTFTADMDEISGFGGGYEDDCRTALRAALLWLDSNPGPAPTFGEMPGAFGLTEGDPRMDQAIDVANAATGNEMTGAMVHAVSRAIVFVNANGWDAYRLAMQRAPAGAA